MLSYVLPNKDAYNLLLSQNGSKIRANAVLTATVKIKMMDSSDKANSKMFPRLAVRKLTLHLYYYDPRNRFLQLHCDCPSLVRPEARTSLRVTSSFCSKTCKYFL